MSNIIFYFICIKVFRYFYTEPKYTYFCQQKTLIQPTPPFNHRRSGKSTSKHTKWLTYILKREEQEAAEGVVVAGTAKVVMYLAGGVELDVDAVSGIQL